MTKNITAAEYNALWQEQIDKEPKKKLIQHESQEQQALFKWRDTQLRKYPELRLMFAIPNGGNRDKITGAIMKSEGVSAGIPDIMLPVMRGGFGGLFLEMKAGKNKATPLQQKWIDDLRAQGYSACVCVGWQEAAEVITYYLERAR